MFDRRDLWRCPFGEPAKGEDAVKVFTELFGGVPDKETQKHIDDGDGLLVVSTIPNAPPLFGWSMKELVSRRQKPPKLPRANKLILPAPGHAMASHKYRIPFVVVSVGDTGKMEISRNLLAPASQASTEFGTISGSLTRTNMWYNNMLDNRPQIAEAMALERHRFLDQPVIIAGSSPSLVKHKPLLDTCEFPTILCNRAVKVINPRGKFYMSIDYLGNSGWYDGVDVSDTEAVFDVLTAHNAIEQPWKKRWFFRQTFATDLANAKAKEFYPNLPMIDPGHCVAYAALGVALWWGADPIIFVGQDFSFTQDLEAHAGEGANSAMPEYGLMKAKDINGNYVPTNFLYHAAARHVMASIILTRQYGDCGGKYVVPRFINATEGGILKGLHEMPLSECLDQLRKDPASLRREQMWGVPFDAEARERHPRASHGYNTEYHGPITPKYEVVDVAIEKDQLGRDVMVRKTGEVELAPLRGYAANIYDTLKTGVWVRPQLEVSLSALRREILGFEASVARVQERLEKPLKRRVQVERWNGTPVEVPQYRMVG